MPKQWTIHSVTGGSAGSALKTCQIYENAAGTAYHFDPPGGGPVSTTSGTGLSAKFPMFRNKLAGTTPQDWYIVITSVTAGPKGNWAAGTWSNLGYLAGDPGNDPPDTWVAQASSLTAEEEAAAASA